MPDLKVGDKCPRCGDRMNEVVRQDFRSDSDKKRFPLKKEDLKILNCRCLHPGDLTIGGFF